MRTHSSVLSLISLSSCARCCEIRLRSPPRLRGCGTTWLRVLGDKRRLDQSLGIAASRLGPRESAAKPGATSCAAASARRHSCSASVSFLRKESRWRDLTSRNVCISANANTNAAAALFGLLMWDNPQRSDNASCRGSGERPFRPWILQPRLDAHPDRPRRPSIFLPLFCR